MIKELDDLLETVESLAELSIKHPEVMYVIKIVIFLSVFVIAFLIIKSLLSFFKRRKCDKCFENSVQVIARNTVLFETINDSIRR